MTWLFSKAMMEAYGKSPCSPGLGAVFSEANCSDTGSCAQLSVMPTPQPFWHGGKTMDCSQLSRFGQTLQLLTDDLGRDVLTSFLAAFPARTSAAPGKEQESTENDPACGPKVRGLLAKWSQQSCGWKTAQCSLLGDSDEFSETWPRWGLMRNGECWELERPVLPTSATACGSSLPTPSGVNGGNNNTMGRVDEWGGSSNPLRGTVIGSMCLPEFEEMVMGWPVMWTAPMPYETAKFREWLLEHGKP